MSEIVKLGETSNIGGDVFRVHVDKADQDYTLIYLKGSPEDGLLVSFEQLVELARILDNAVSFHERNHN
jgi:hypothetical protein